MQNVGYILLLLISFFPILISQQLTDSSADDFIQKLLLPSSDVRQRIDSAELAFAERLDIQYNNVSQKFFIGNNFPDSIKTLVQSKRVHYSYSIQSLDEFHSLLTVSIPTLSIQQKYYFKGQICISPVSYFTNVWNKREGKYLSYRISDSTVFNFPSMKKLDGFVERVMKILHFTKEETMLLQKKKILYIRCANEEEVEQITGFKSLGMALLSYDAVVTQFNCHYHELVHLLINYKLKRLPLYTHSFFQEGFAVAVGGRGGKEPKVILELGHFIAKSGFESYQSLLDRNGFASVDPSISYALSGLYNMFLLSEIGSEKYKNLYLTYSNTNPDLIKRILEELLPSQKQWSTFLTSYTKHRSITFPTDIEQKKVLWSQNNERVSACRDGYLFEIKDSLTILSKDHKVKYIVTVTPEEIRIFNAASGNTIANFVVAFSSPPESIPYDGHTYKFSVRKKVFDESLSKNLSFIVD